MARSLPDWLGIDETNRRRRVSLDLEQLEPRVLLNGGSPQVERVSLAWDGSEGLAGSGCPAISEDGRYVAFVSWASNLVSDDTNGMGDVFVVDRDTGGIERVSVSSAGQEGNDSSGGSEGSPFPAISADGRYVAFESCASNLVPGDANGCSDVFVYDRQTSSIERVSVASGGGDANADSYGPSISADGWYVAFDSDASNLVPGDTNGYPDVFVRDRQTGITERVSLASGGAQGNWDSMRASISGDGRYVAFESWASNLVPGDANDRTDVFVYDRQTSSIERVSVASDGTEANGFSWEPSVSADGRYVAFESYASNLVTGDTNGSCDVFVHDRQSGSTERVSVASGGGDANADSYGPSISADGWYVAFDSDASNLVPGDTNGYPDVFVRDRQTGITERVSLASGGAQGNWDSMRASISGDGRYVAFESLASNLVSDDANGVDDVFVGDLGGRGGVTGVIVGRTDDRGYPGTGDEEFEYSVEATGTELTRLELTTPWDEAFDSADYVGPVWDGADYDYEVPGFEFDAYLEGGECHFDVWWGDLSAGQWADLNANSTDMTITYAGGTWTGSVDFTGTSFPTEVPVFVHPTHGATDVALSPTIEWEAWASPGPDRLVSVWLEDDAFEVQERLAADATSWAVPEALDSDTQYDCRILFANYKTVDVSGVSVLVASCTESDVQFATAAPGVTEVLVARGDDRRYPGTGDDEFDYSVEATGTELTRLELTTPWDEAFDSADYVGPVWDGTSYKYDGTDLHFEAYVEEGGGHLHVHWDGLTTAQWANLNANSTDMTITYAGGTWTGSVDFTGTSLPTEVPVFVHPTHGAAGVALSPTIEWEAWTSPGPDAGVNVGVEDETFEVEEHLAADATSWAVHEVLDSDTQYHCWIVFAKGKSVDVNGLGVLVASYTESDVQFTTATPGVTDVLVWRGDDRNSPATGDEDLEYHVEVWGLDLTRLELTTPWDEAFDSADYFGGLWDGTYYEYDGADLYFGARVDGGECHFDVSWEDLSAGQWASLDTGDTDLTVTYTGGSWVGTVDFSQAAVPSEVPVFVHPTHGATDVALSPTIEWEAWASPGPDPLVVVWLQDETFEVEEHLAADATSWAVPEALDSDTQYDCAIGFLNCKTVGVNGLGVVVVSCTESDVGFTTGRAGLTGVCVQREYHYNLPVPGDEALGYRVEIQGNELTRMQLTTPWGEGFDSADYVGPVWDGTGYDYEVSGFEFDAYVEGGERHFDVAWGDLSAGQWDSLDTGDTDLTVTYTGGSWAATADFTAVAVPDQAPQMTYPAHEQTGVPLGPMFRWDAWTSPGPDAAVGVWLEGDTFEVEELLAADATSWIPAEDLDPATDYTCALLFVNYEQAPLNGVDVQVVSYAGSDSEFTTLSSVADVVLGIDVEQIWDYDYPSDPLTYQIDIEVGTIPGVELVEFTTPALNTYQIPAVPHQQVGYVETSYESDGDSCWWYYGTEFPDPSYLDDYGDGTYTFTIHLGGDELQTSVWFGIPGTSDPIPQPTQEPVMTYPVHQESATSPVTFLWEACTDASAAYIWVDVKEPATDQTVVEDGVDTSSTSYGPVSLAPAGWEIDLDFGQGYGATNADGIPFYVGKCSESDTEFTVLEAEPDVPGDTITDALVTAHDGSDKVLWYSYGIGDGLYGALDVDMYEVHLDDAGDLLIADVDAEEIGSSLDSILRVFDSSGAELAWNDDWNGWDSRIEFLAPGPGVYYVGVSSFDNDAYDPWTAGSGSGEEVWPGYYDLMLEVQDAGEPGADVPGDTIPEAMPTGHDGSDRLLVYSYEIGDGLYDDRDVDILSVTLDDAGDTLVADVDAEEIGSGLDPVLEILDAAGSELAYNDDSNGLDSYLGWSPADSGLGAGTYYVVVRGFGNSDYDPFTAGSGLGGSTGIYDLRLEVWDAGAPGADVPGDTIPDALVTAHDGSDKVLSYSYDIGDGLYGGADVDIYAVYLDGAADVLIIDVDAESIGSTLDPVLEILDSSGSQWAYNDDSDGLDAYLQWSPADWDLEPGAYYVVVRGWGNSDYDPWEAGWGSGGSTGYYDLVLEVRDGAAAGPDVPGDTIADAFMTGHDGSGKVLSYRYTIGDGLHGALDVDMYAVSLDGAGDVLIADVDARTIGSALDSLLRVFDAGGNEMPLVSEWHGYDSRIEFEAAAPGTYYVGVSGLENAAYDPNAAASGSAASTGFYRIALEVWDGGAPATDVPGDTMAEALVTEHDGSDKTLQYSHVIGDNAHGASDVDMFRINIPVVAGGSFRLSADVDAYNIGSGLDSVLRVFDGAGAELACNDDAVDPGTALFSCDSYLSIPVGPGTYYVGVSSFPNDLYDPTVAGSGVGDTTGGYTLYLRVAPFVAAADAGDRLGMATAMALTPNAWTEVRGHTIEPATDVDLFSFSVQAGSTVTFDVDAVELGSGLDSVLRLFDATGTELDWSDDEQDPETGVFSTDSALVYTFDEAGTYYVGVSGYPNFDYDPVVAGFGVEGSTGEYLLKAFLMPRGEAVFSVDFTSPAVSALGATVDVGPGFQYNSYYGQNWRMTLPGSSYFEVTFDLLAPQALELSVVHLTSSSAGAPGGGYSPTDVVVNDADANPFNETNLLLNNYDVAEHHGYSHGWQVDTFVIPADRLQAGTNTIAFAFEDSPWAYTHYWIQELAAAVYQEVPAAWDMWDAAVVPGTDSDGDGYCADVSLQWDADTTRTSAEVYAVIYARNESGAEVTSWQTAPYVIYDAEYDWASFDVSGLSHGDWDFRMALYDASKGEVVSRLAYGDDMDWVNIPLETQQEDAELFRADFTGAQIVSSGIVIQPRGHFAYDSQRGGQWRMIDPGADYFIGTFNLAAGFAGDLELRVTHATSLPVASADFAVSPVDVIVNDANASAFDGSDIIPEGNDYDAYLHHGDYALHTDTFIVPAWMLNPGGANTLVVAFAGGVSAAPVGGVITPYRITAISAAAAVAPAPDFWFADVGVNLITDADGDGYYAEAEVAWDVDTAQGPVDVYVVVHGRDSSGSEVLIGQSDPYTVSGIEVDQRALALEGLSEDLWDIGLDLYEAGTDEPLASMDYGLRPALVNAPLESAFEVLDWWAITDARMNLLTDQDADGFYRLAEVQWNADTSLASSDVYAVVRARDEQGNVYLVGRSDMHAVHGEEEDWAALTVSELPQGYWDFNITLRNSKDGSVVAVLDFGEDPDLEDVSFELPQEDQAEAWFADARRSARTDEDGDGYARGVTLEWDVDTALAGVSVYVKVFGRNSGGHEFLVLQDAPYAVHGAAEDWRQVLISDLSRDAWDFRLELYDAATDVMAASLEYGAEWTMMDVQMEPVAQDVAPVWSISDPAAQTSGDQDGDGYCTQAAVSATVTAENVDTARAYVIVYARDAGEREVAREYFEFTGGLPQVVTVTVADLPHDEWSFCMGVYDAASNALLSSLPYGEVGGVPLETLSQDQRARWWVADAQVAPRTDEDADGYYREAEIRWNADTNLSSSSVYAGILAFDSRGNLSHTFYTDAYTIYGDSPDWRTFVVSGLARDDWDFRVVLYESSSGDQVAAQGYGAAQTDADLADVPLESRAQDALWDVRDARISLGPDLDGDGFFRSVTLEWDANTSLGTADVYAVVSARDGAERSWTSDTYAVQGSNVDWHAMPVAGLPQDVWDFRIELHDAATGEVVAALDYGADADLTAVGLEAADQDRIPRLTQRYSVTFEALDQPIWFGDTAWLLDTGYMAGDALGVRAQGAFLAGTVDVVFTGTLVMEYPAAVTPGQQGVPVEIHFEGAGNGSLAGGLVLGADVLLSVECNLSDYINSLGIADIDYEGSLFDVLQAMGVLTQSPDEWTFGMQSAFTPWLGQETTVRQSAFMEEVPFGVVQVILDQLAPGLAGLVGSSADLEVGVGFEIERSDYFTPESLEGMLSYAGRMTPFVLDGSGSTTVYLNIPAGATGSIFIDPEDLVLDNAFQASVQFASELSAQANGLLSLVPYLGDWLVARQAEWDGFTPDVISLALPKRELSFSISDPEPVQVLVVTGAIADAFPSMIGEPGDTLPAAKRIAVSYGGPHQATGWIGDNPYGAADVDFYSFNAAAGSVLQVDIDAQEIGSELDAVARLFDASGRELAMNDDGVDSDTGFGGLDSYLRHTFAYAGTYYVGVSGFPDLTYNPFASNSGQGWSTGAYHLRIGLEPPGAVVAGGDNDDSVATARVVDLLPGLPLHVDGFIGDGAFGADDVDLFEVTAGGGLLLTADVDAQEIGSSLDSMLRVFDDAGYPLALSDDARDPDTGFYGLDSALACYLPDAGTYYVGVSGYRNSEYDPTTVGTGSDGASVGEYGLRLLLTLMAAPAADDNDTLAAADALALRLNARAEATGVIGDNACGADDVDIYAVQGQAGMLLRLDVDAEEFGIELDSVLRVFDSVGTEVARNDDATDPQSGYAGTDSYVTYVLPATGTYYVGVSSYPDFTYDPTVAGSGEGYSVGPYALGVEALPAREVGLDVGDTLASARRVAATPGSPVQVVAQIGDGLFGSNDVDVFAVAVEGPAVITADIDAAEVGSALDSVLRLFDADGNELAWNDDGVDPDSGYSGLDSSLTHWVAQSGSYYIGVSSYRNFDYDPMLAGSGSNGWSGGQYRLNVKVTGALPPADDNDTMAAATPLTLQQNVPVQASGSIGDGPYGTDDVDLYSFQSGGRAILSVDVDACELGSSLDSVVRLFDAGGNELAVNDDGTDPETGYWGWDSALQYRLTGAGTYYVGVSSYDNFDYDPHSAGSGQGESEGQYVLLLALRPGVAPGGDVGDDLAAPGVADVAVGRPYQAVSAIGDGSYGPDDVDVYAFQAPSGGLVRVDVDAQVIGSGLDAVVRLFDSAGNELAANDDAADPNTGVWLLDPALEFAIGQGGTYYVAVSSYGNSNCDPAEAGTGSGGATMGEYVLAVELYQERAVEAPVAVGALEQVIYLDFDGGTFRDFGGTAVAIPAFDVTDFGFTAGDRGALIGAVLDYVRQDLITGGSFEVPATALDLPVEIVSSRPAGVLYSTVYVGGKANVLGEAQGLDFGNLDPTDDAAVYAESIAALLFVELGGQPTLEQAAQALANTISHEVGHVLGLVHVAEDGRLMQAGSLDWTHVDNERYGIGTVYDWPPLIGQVQNAPAILRQNLQLSLDVAGINDVMADATPLLLGYGLPTRILKAIDREGDVDLYGFSASAGDRLRVDVDAWSVGSGLDARVRILRADGSVLAVSDQGVDPSTGAVGFDPFLQVELDRTGTCYVEMTGDIVAQSRPGVAPGAYAMELSLSSSLAQGVPGVLYEEAGPKARMLTTGQVYSFTDSDGDHVRVSWFGPGAATVALQGNAADGADIASISIADAASYSSLAVYISSASGGGATSVGAMTVDSAQMGTIVLGGYGPFGGQVGDITGTGRIFRIDVHGQMAGVALIDGSVDLVAAQSLAGTSALTIHGSVQYMSVAGQAAGVIAVDNVLARLTVGGDLLAGLSAGSVGTLTVGGDLGYSTDFGGSRIEVDGSVQTITVAGDFDGSMRVGGNLSRLQVAGDFHGDLELPGGNMDVLWIAGELSGNVNVNGAIWNLAAAAVTESGVLNARQFGGMSVAGGFEGRVGILLDAGYVTVQGDVQGVFEVEDGVGLVVYGSVSEGAFVRARGDLDILSIMGSVEQDAMVAAFGSIGSVRIGSPGTGGHVGGGVLAGYALGADLAFGGSGADADVVNAGQTMGTLLVLGAGLPDDGIWQDGFVAATGGISFALISGDMQGAIVAGALSAGDDGDISTLDVGQEFSSSADIGGVIVSGGSLAGPVVAGGDLSMVIVSGGRIEGDLSALAGDVGTVMAQASSGGGISGDVYASGSVSTVLAIGGGISGDVVADAGSIGSVLASGAGSSITSSVIQAGGSIGMVQAGSGGVASSIISSGGINMVMAGKGDIDLRDGRRISAGGSVNAVQASGGGILGDGDPGTADISVASGSIGRLAASGGGVDGIVIDVNRGTSSGGRINGVSVTGGGITNSAIEADSSIVLVNVIGGDVDASIVSPSGSIGQVMAQRSGGTGGNIAGTIDAPAGVAGVMAFGGDLSATITSTSGKVSTIFSQAAAGQATGGSITGDVLAGNGIGSVFASRDLRCAIDVTDGDLSSVAVLGTIRDSSINVAAGKLASLYAAGDLRSSDVHARTLGALAVGGRIYQDIGGCCIHAQQGQFFASDADERAWVDDGTHYGEHWFDGDDPDGVRAYVA